MRIVRFRPRFPALLLAVLLLAACSDPAAEPNAAPPDTTAARDSTASRPLLQALRRQQRFGLFTTLVDSAGFGPTLRSGQPYTVFAATDSGLDHLPDGVVEELLLPQNRDRLTSVLGYHIHPGKLSPKDVRAADSVSTLTRRWLPVTLEGGRIMIGEATMSERSFAVRNGRIYVIDALVLPPLGSGVPDLPAPPAPDTLGDDSGISGDDSGISGDDSEGSDGAKGTGESSENGNGKNGGTSSSSGN